MGKGKINSMGKSGIAAGAERAHGERDGKNPTPCWGIWGDLGGFGKILWIHPKDLSQTQEIPNPGNPKTKKSQIQESPNPEHPNPKHSKSRKSQIQGTPNLGNPKSGKPQVQDV